jgi:hypothetical protein
MAIATVNANNSSAVGDAVQDGSSWRLTQPYAAGSYQGNSTPTAIATTSIYGDDKVWDTDLSNTGSANSGYRSDGELTNQRLAVDLGASPFAAYGCRIANGHHIGTQTDLGAKNVVIYGSNNAADYSSVYGTDNAMVQLWSGQLDEHTAVDEVDWQELTFSNAAAYRYIIVEIADNWGSTYAITVRRIQLLSAVEDGTPSVIITSDELDAGVEQAFDHATALENATGAPSASYEYTDDAGASSYASAGNIAALQAVSNTGHRLERFRITVTGDAGDLFDSLTIETYALDLTPPSVPSIGTIESVGADPNLGFFSDWTEPTDTDFNNVQVECNIDGAGWLSVESDADLAASSDPMKFNESKAGSQVQEAGWLYQNHFARNGYGTGTTVQVRARSFDNIGNNSAYSTSALLTMEDEATAPGTPAATLGSTGDSQLTINVVPAEETDTVYLRYSAGSVWSAEDETLKVTGTGTITPTGLTNEALYKCILYAKKANGLTSDWTFPIYATPTGGSLTPVGVISITKSLLRDALASCSSWQTWVEAANAEEAKQSIHMMALPEVDGEDYATTLTNARPYAIIGTGEELFSNQIAGGMRNYLQPGGDAILLLEANVPDAYRAASKLDDAAVWFDNKIGAVMDDLAEKGGLSEGLAITGINLVDGPYRTEKKEHAKFGDCFVAIFSISWGQAG